MTQAGFLEADLALGVAPESLLGVFNRAGVLSAADVHVALTLDRLGRSSDALVQLAAALAVRAPRAGHVLADLATAPSTVLTGSEAEVGLDELPWPEPSTWLERVARSELVSTPSTAAANRPLRLEGSALYLQRYWRDECFVAAELLRRAGAPPLGLNEGRMEQALDRLFPDDSSGHQREAAAKAARYLLSVIAGGPGTGKTTTVARFLALAHDQFTAADRAAPLVALSAPTGKAAARVAEAVHDEARRLPLDEAAREWMAGIDASTVDRLLGHHPGGGGRFRHDRQNQLPHDIVVVDETSMMSLPLMASLLEAVRPDARLVLLGDPEQLASVEAGAVLADIVGPARDAPAAPGSPVARCITVLLDNHRFQGALAEVAAAARAGAADTVVATLRYPPGEGVSWLEVDPAGAETETLSAVLGLAGNEVEALVERSARGDAPGALRALGRFRLLCAHREGPAGASTWNALIERWLATRAAAAPPSTEWYPGRPVVVTENDYSLGLWNGDLGVVVREGDRLVVVFQRGASLVRVSPSRLTAVQSAFAMTAHRAQGSEFDEVVFVLPPAPARILTRELFYTAVTRARSAVTVVGTEEAVRFAVERPVARASGLAARLWAAGAGGPVGAGSARPEARP
jgi:exodeoxyribonuclease V alpha subunit